MLCFLVLLFAMMVLLGVPKNHRGPHGAQLISGLQKPHLCKQLPNNFGPKRSHQTLRHSHNKPHKSNPAFHREYKKCCNGQKVIMSHQILYCIKRWLLNEWTSKEALLLWGILIPFTTACVQKLFGVNWFGRGVKSCSLLPLKLWQYVIFLASAGLIKVERKGARKGARGQRVWLFTGSNTIKCATLGTFFFFLFLSLSRWGVKPNLNMKGFDTP